MARSDLHKQICRLLGHVEAGTTDMGGGISTVSVGNYTCPERLARERTDVLQRMPVIVAASGEIEEPGDCLVYDALGVPLLIVRDDDGRVRAFINACRHRGTRLVDRVEVCRQRAFKCPYHNWVYGLDGCLKAVPQAFGFEGLDWSDYGLVSVPATERFGFVWVVADRTGTLDLDAHLGGLAGDFAYLGLDDHRFFRRERTRRKTNWKLIADAFLEAYHVKRLHKDSIAPFFTDNEAASERIGPHVRSAIARERTAELADLPEDEWRIGEHVTFAYFIFPCSVAITQPDHFTVINLLPQSVDDTIVDHIMLLPAAPQTDEEREHVERAFAFMDAGVINSEDVWVAEQAQKALHSGANDVMTFGRFEHQIKYFHDQLDQALESS